VGKDFPAKSFLFLEAAAYS